MLNTKDDAPINKMICVPLDDASYIRNNEHYGKWKGISYSGPDQVVGSYYTETYGINRRLVSYDKYNFKISEINLEYGWRGTYQGWIIPIKKWTYWGFPGYHAAGCQLYKPDMISKLIEFGSSANKIKETVWNPDGTVKKQWKR